MDENKGLPYFFLGLGVGVAVGMIFAPKAGAETRTLIRTRAGESGEYLRRRGSELKQGAGSLVDKGKEAVSRQRQNVSSAIDAGRQAYRDTVSGGTSNSAPDLAPNPPAEGI
jgi:gas vesicle protein